MKKRTKLQLSLLLMLSATVTSCSIEDNNPVDPIDPYDSEEGGVYNPNAGSAPEGVVAVDLDLPSGTLWANMNVGATSPEDYGLYFAWGETTGYTGGHSFDWASYKWMNEGQSNWRQVNKYQIDDWETEGCWYDSDGNFIGDGKTVLDLEDDAAHANWGGDWRMPTIDEIKELIENTTSYEATVHGVKGLRFRSKETYGNSIFLPYAGYCTDKALGFTGSWGYYWSASLSPTGATSAAYSLSINSYYGWGYEERFRGFPVRPVRTKAPAPEEGLVAVDMGLPSGTKWANMNVGAEKPEDYGLYFAWGETTGYTDDTTDGHSFNWASYKWCNGSNRSMTKYCTYKSYGTVDGKYVLDLEDDAAYAILGGDWRMPTYSEVNELLNYTTEEWKTVNGVKGRRFTSVTNGNSIFLPAAGYRSDKYLNDQGTDGYYWLTSLYNDGNLAYEFYFSSGSAKRSYMDRRVGLTVRPVLRE